MTANNTHIAMATVNIMESTMTNIQVVYRDLETEDLLYRLIWDDKAAAEQRLGNLSHSPQQEAR